MKKLKLVALLAIFALVVATFVTMLVMPASAAAVTDAGTDTALYEFASDSAALAGGAIGRFGDAEGGKVYVKSLAGLLNGGTPSDTSPSRLGSSDAYLKFNLLTDLTTSVRLRFYNFDGSKIRTTAAVFDGNGHTITSTSGQAQHFRGNVTIKNLTITGAVDNLVQAASSGVVLGSGVTISNTKANGHPIIVSSNVTLTVDGATVTGTVNNTNGVIVPWGNGCTINVKSGKVINNSTDSGNGAAALSFARSSMTGTTFNISGGTIQAVRPINYPSTNQSTNKLNISGGTITCKDSTGANGSYCIMISGGTSNAVINITGGTFNGEGTFLAESGTNNTINFGGTAVVNTSRTSRGFIQGGGGTNNTINITGGTINSVGYGMVLHSAGTKVNISGGTLKADNNFVHLGGGSEQSVTITGNPTIICGASKEDHDKYFVYSNIATAKEIKIAGGEIYCGDFFTTADGTTTVVDVVGGTIYCNNALYSTGSAAGGVLNISGGTFNCDNAALWVTSGAAVLNVYDGATINAFSLARTRQYAAANATAGTAEVAASTGTMNLNVYGGDVNCTGSDVIFLALNQEKNTSFKSNVKIYGGDFTTTHRFIQAVNGGEGTVDIYGGTFASTCAPTTNIHQFHPINVTSNGSKMTINIWGGTFKSIYDYEDTGTDTNITAGTVYMSAGGAFVNVYGGRFYLLDDINNLESLSTTGTHLCPWAGAMDNMKLYGGEFYGGEYVYTSLAHSGGKVDEANTTRTSMVEGEYLLAPKTNTGASIRIAADSMGIRFESTITKAVLDSAKQHGTVTYGTIITPLDFGLAYGADLLNNSANYIKIAATSAGTTTDANGNVTFRAALTNVQEANLSRQFVACAYIEITTAGGEVITIYSNDKAIRSIDEVAKAALADFKTEVEETETVYVYQTSIYYDTTSKKYVIGTTPVYTRYNDAQISAIRKCSPAQ